MAKVGLGFEFALGFAFDSDRGQAALLDSKKNMPGFVTNKINFSLLHSASQWFSFLSNGDVHALRRHPD